MVTEEKFSLKINKKQIMKSLASIDSWEKWNEFEEKYFQVSKWPDLEKDYNRKDTQVGNTLWIPISFSYCISADLYEFSMCVSDEIFAKLEPEAAKDNGKNPERYYKYCCYCAVATNNYLKVLCDFCGSRLLKDVQPHLQK